MVVHKVPIKQLNENQQLQMVTQQPTNFHRNSKPVPLVRQAPVFDLEVITSDNFVPWVCIEWSCKIYLPVINIININIFAVEKYIQYASSDSGKYYRCSKW